MKFIPSHVSFILKSNSENCIKIRWFLTKLQTKLSWLLFYGPRCRATDTHPHTSNNLVLRWVNQLIIKLQVTRATTTDRQTISSCIEPASKDQQSGTPRGSVPACPTDFGPSVNHMHYNTVTPLKHTASTDCTLQFHYSYVTANCNSVTKSFLSMTQVKNSNYTDISALFILHSLLQVKHAENNFKKRRQATALSVRATSLTP